MSVKELPGREIRRASRELAKVTMIEGEYASAEVLNQLGSAHQAAKSLAEKIISDHLEHCLTANSTADQRRKQLKEATMVLGWCVE